MIHFVRECAKGLQRAVCLEVCKHHRLFLDLDFYEIEKIILFVQNLQKS